MLLPLWLPFASGYLSAESDCGENGCWSHGTCKHGVCACEAGYGGAHCRDVLDDVCPNNCGGHGRCNVAADPPVCECHAGFTGYDCTFVMPFICAGNCGGHGRCLGDNRSCACDAGFAGEGCERATLSDCPGGCMGHGACVAGQCKCHAGFGGARCGTLAPVGCPAQCSGQGFCRLGVGVGGSGGVTRRGGGDGGNGGGSGGGVACACEPGIGGAGCERVVPYERCPHNCSAHGVCGAAGCACRAENGEFNWQGDGCEALAPVAGCELGCSGHGTCTATRGYPGQGTCHCTDGFEGAWCERERHCPNRCNGPSHGTCVLGKCACQPEWEGAACTAPRCTSNCSGRGSCMAPSVEGGRPGCLCEGGWSGLGCEARVPWCPNDCSLHGTCTDGRCSCDAGFVGGDCAVAEGAAPSAARRFNLESAQELASSAAAAAARAGSCAAVQCGAHGRCHASRGALLCACFEGYGGYGCELHNASRPRLSQAEVQELVRKNAAANEIARQLAAAQSRQMRSPGS